MTAPTRDTTQIDGVIFGLPMAVLALAILLWAAHALPPAWSALFVQSAIEPQNRYEALARGAAVGDPELAALSRTLRRTGDPASMARAAQVQLLRAQRVGVTSLRAQQLATQAVRDLRVALAAAPADTHAWMRLAVAHYLLQEKAPAARALSMSLRTAKSDAALLAMQLDLAVIVWDELDGTARVLIADRLRADKAPGPQRDEKEGHSARLLREMTARPPPPQGS